MGSFVFVGVRVAHLFRYLCCVFVCRRHVFCVRNGTSVSELSILARPVGVLCLFTTVLHFTLYVSPMMFC